MIILRWCKVIDDETKEVQLGVGQNAEFYQAIGMTEQEVEQSYEGRWYLKGYAPAEPVPTHEEIVKEQIVDLERQITDRNIRGAILGDEFALSKIQNIEAQIEELRRELEESGSL